MGHHHQLRALRCLLGEGHEGGQLGGVDDALGGVHEAGVQPIGEQNGVDAAAVFRLGEDLLDGAVASAPPTEGDATKPEILGWSTLSHGALNAVEQLREGGRRGESVLVGAGAHAEVHGDEHRVVEVGSLKRGLDARGCAVEVKQ